jgi:hypothetical protein
VLSGSSEKKKTNGTVSVYLGWSGVAMIDLMACVKVRTAVGDVSFFMVVCVCGGGGIGTRNKVYCGRWTPFFFFTLEIL